MSDNSGLGADSIFLSTVNGLNQIDPSTGALLPPSLNHPGTSIQLVMMDNTVDAAQDVVYLANGTVKKDKMPSNHMIMTGILRILLAKVWW